MQVSHVISDLILTAAGVYAFAGSFARLGSRFALLWGVFLIPVSLAAFFGAMRFAGVHESMVDISNVFQIIATTLGSGGLMLGAYGLVSKNQLQSWSIAMFLCIGLMLLVMVMLWDVRSIRNLMPMVAMLSVAGCGISAVWSRKTSLGIFLLLGVALSALAVGAIGGLANESLKIDVYHYLLAASLVCFAMAGRSYKSRQHRPLALASTE